MTEKKRVTAGIPWELIRSGRRTIGLQVTRDCRVLVRAPMRTPEAALSGFVEAHAGWIRKNLARMLASERAAHAEAPFSDAEIRRMEREARPVFLSRAAYFAPLVGVDYGRITVRCQKTRWGSCSSEGNLNFNCLLLLAPREVLDYVVVHELCHRKEMNHSKRFWANVERVDPGFRASRSWLKECGTALLRRAATAKESNEENKE